MALILILAWQAVRGTKIHGLIDAFHHASLTKIAQGCLLAMTGQSLVAQLCVEPNAWTGAEFRPEVKPEFGPEVRPQVYMCGAPRGFLPDCVRF
jgi:hypothetical protein